MCGVFWFVVLHCCWFGVYLTTVYLSDLWCWGGCSALDFGLGVVGLSYLPLEVVVCCWAILVFWFGVLF